MKILSIDTSGWICGAAIVDSAAGLLASAALNLDAVKSSHSVHLMAIIEFILSKSGCEIRDMDAFAAVVGPGSFTGLRVGIATIKGLSYATGRPVAAVSSLEALAWNFPFAASPVCAIIDARQGEVYAAVYHWADGGFKAIEGPTLLRISDLLALGALNEGRVLFTGAGVNQYKNIIDETLGSSAIFAETDKVHISPFVVGTIGLKAAARGEYSPNIRPVYIKMPLAVERLKDAHRHSNDK
ncbi:MAG: tRNA (adenosine(37)-N6)-threonylcarbamoyltransferase complex dimerization subunit type 1 TsaB [Nitrospirae bacterium]|nr:tRNA (adenosine(37)-N6)-threonylcarbamoyltransferase complex dimerization subunit type 1 TsaB [Nitrospirota bacterium]